MLIVLTEAYISTYALVAAKQRAQPFPRQAGRVSTVLMPSA